MLLCDSQQEYGFFDCSVNPVGDAVAEIPLLSTLPLTPTVGKDGLLGLFTGVF